VPKSSRIQEQRHKEQIIDILKKNAKTSTEKIAQQVGLSRQQVWKIIKQLEQDGIIWGYSAIVDPNRLNMRVYNMLIKSRPTIGYEVLANEIRDFHKVPPPPGIKWLSLCYLHGNYDWLVVFAAKGTIEAKKAEDWIKKRYGKYMQEYILEEVVFPFVIQGVTNPNIGIDLKKIFS
jgi:DNA-binding Lrp family transcriptional regulator